MLDYDNHIAENLVSMTQVLFGGVPVSDLLKQKVCYDSISYQTMGNYMSQRRDIYNSYSDMECLNMAEAIGDFICDHDELRMRTSRRGYIQVFDLLTETLVLLLKFDNSMVCRYSQILEWRRLIHSIGEEIPVSIMYALQDMMTGKNNRTYFGWDPVIGHNNRQLNNIVHRGISEHHFHLFGSIPYFQISWINLMNQVQNNVYSDRLRQIEKQSNAIQSASFIEGILNNTLSPKDALSNLEITHLQAALIRFYLAAKVSQKTNLLVALYEIIVETATHSDYLTEKEQQNLIDQIYQVLQCSWKLILIKDKFQSLISSIRIYSNAASIDYIFNFFLPQNISEEEDLVLVGERWFIYSIAQDVYFSSEFNRLTKKDHNLFFIYLRSQIDFRKQMVQANDKVGFDNFQKFEKRKTFFLKNDRLSVSMAIRQPLLKNSHLLELEARISPYESSRRNYKWISFLDTSILKSRPEYPGILLAQEDTDAIKKRYYFIVHFIKRPDTSVEKLSELSSVYSDEMFSATIYRHYKLRKKLQNQANALIDFRKRYPQTASRIKGIDAASQEITCRPEIFAPVFRKLDCVSRSDYDPLQQKKLFKLGKTYHVGEDFLDIIDGLRAIDEAVHFLNLDSGDRLGHALALGIDANEWYYKKGYQVTLPVQNYIDNLAWMYHTLQQYDINGCEHLKGRLKEQFNYYFVQVYKNNMKSADMNSIMENGVRAYQGDSRKRNYQIHECIFNIDFFYQSWCLRGDHPKLYEKGYYSPLAIPFDKQYMFMTNEQFPYRFDIRYIPECSLLNYYYQYNPLVKKAGRRPITVNIPQEYVEGCQKIQLAMRYRIAQRGIVIETNPSSNVLISTFRKYEKHPISTFYNRGLLLDPSLQNQPQIGVSINTDDSGVFFTNLDNEYALLARSLEIQKDESGIPLYEKSCIYDWLERIRRMGNEQGFQSVAEEVSDR